MCSGLSSCRAYGPRRLSAFCLFSRASLHPLVVKGIVCRNLYPRPDYRVSGDEDVWIPWEEYEACHKAMLEFGMAPADPEQDIQAAHEVPYSKKGSSLYIELHKSLFPPESKAYGDLNRFFENAREHAIRVPASAAPGSVVTLGDGSMSRKHSSTITLEAVSAQKEGRRASHGLAKSLFPSASDLKGRYTYLEKMPWLLPAAWVQRILKYRQEISHAGSNSGGNTAAEAIEIGRQRVDLLRKYGILDK